MLDAERWAELRREHFVRGVSIKALVRRAGLARNTIRLALRSSEPPAFAVPERPSKLEPFRDEIHRLPKDDPMLPGVRVRELIALLGVDCAETIIDDAHEVHPHRVVRLDQASAPVALGVGDQFLGSGELLAVLGQELDGRGEVGARQARTGCGQVCCSGSGWVSSDSAAASEPLQ